MPRKYRMPRHAVTQPSDPSYRLIPLTRKQNALVDTEDFDFLNRWNWCALLIPDKGTFYAVRVTPENHMIYMHRVVLGLKGKEQADHRYGNTLDNRKKNLRPCTCAQNVRNGRLRKNNISGFRGVHFVKREQMWVAYIRTNYRRKHLGYFDTAKEAAHAYDAAAKILHGEFASLNFHE